MKIKSIFVYLTLLALLFSFAGCSGGDEPAAEGETAVSAPTESENGESGGEETAVSSSNLSNEQTNSTNSTNETTTDNTSFVDSFFAHPNETLDSYRMVTEMQFVSDDGSMNNEAPMTMEITWVRNPPAEHTITSGILPDTTMETIIIGNQTWTTMGDGTWIESTAIHEHDSPEMQNMMADLEDMLADIQNSMVPVGKERANGFQCQKYEVDADFTFAMPLPTDEEDPNMEQFFPNEFVGHINGNIWIADETGLPPVIVRSYTTQSLTMQFESGEGETMVYEEKRDLYDLNLPIIIEPPAGAVVMPNPSADAAESAVTDAPSADSTSDAPDVEIGSLESLDSFRMEWTVLMDMGDEGSMGLSNLVEWVREPYAVRVDLGMGNESLGQFIVVGDQAWAQMGSTWINTTEDEVTASYADIAETMLVPDDAIYVGEEVVDGMNCLHYVYDFQEMIHQEWWVVDESDLPAIVIKTDFQMNMEGMNTQTLGRVYDINTPITIEPPQS